MIKYEIPEILKEHESMIKETMRHSNEITFKGDIVNYGISFCGKNCCVKVNEI